MRASSKRGGFARHEVAGAMGIMGAVAALVVPAGAQGSILDLIFGERNRSKGTTCQSNLKQLGLAVMQYVQDYDEILPRATYKPTAKYDSFGWAFVIQPYIKSTLLNQCPSEKHVRGSEEMRGDLGGYKKAGYIDYWYSSKMSGLSLSALVDPPSTLSMGDGDGGSPLSNARYNLGALPKSWISTPGSPARRHSIRGEQGANYAFADGHVKWYKPTSIFNAPVKTASGPTFAVK